MQAKWQRNENNAVLTSKNWDIMQFLFNLGKGIANNWGTFVKKNVNLVRSYEVGGGWVGSIKKRTRMDRTKGLVKNVMILGIHNFSMATVWLEYPLKHCFNSLIVPDAGETIAGIASC